MGLLRFPLLGVGCVVQRRPDGIYVVVRIYICRVEYCVWSLLLGVLFKERLLGVVYLLFLPYGISRVGVYVEICPRRALAIDV